MSACCGPPRPSSSTASGPEETYDQSRAGSSDAVGDLVPIAAGSFTMGTDDTAGYPADGEGPAHEVELPSVRDRGARPSRTTSSPPSSPRRAIAPSAEQFGASFVYAGLLPDDFPPTTGVAASPWWRQVEGSDWRHPEGPSRTSPIAATIRWCTSAGSTPWRSARGAATACPPRRSGSAPHAAAWPARTSRGATSSSPDGRAPR